MITYLYQGIDVLQEFKRRKRLWGCVEETEEICLELCVENGWEDPDELIDFVYVFLK